MALVVLAVVLTVIAFLFPSLAIFDRRTTGPASAWVAITLTIPGVIGLSYQLWHLRQGQLEAMHREMNSLQSRMVTREWKRCGTTPGTLVDILVQNHGDHKAMHVAVELRSPDGSCLQDDWIIRTAGPLVLGARSAERLLLRAHVPEKHCHRWFPERKLPPVRVTWTDAGRRSVAMCDNNFAELESLGSHD